MNYCSDSWRIIRRHFNGDARKSSEIPEEQLKENKLKFNGNKKIEKEDKTEKKRLEG